MKSSRKKELSNIKRRKERKELDKLWQKKERILSVCLVLSSLIAIFLIICVIVMCGKFLIDYIAECNGHNFTAEEHEKSWHFFLQTVTIIISLILMYLVLVIVYSFLERKIDKQLGSELNEHKPFKFYSFFTW